MYLTRIKLDMTKTNTMKALVCPSRFHGAIESAESDGRTRKLWRIDELGGEKYLLILSEKELDFSNVSDQFGAKDRKLNVMIHYLTELKMAINGSFV